MQSANYKVESGEWCVEGGEWCVEGGEWRVVRGGCSLKTEEYRVKVRNEE